MYDPRAWYWRADDGVRLYASAAGALIEDTDPAYLAWQAGGHVATRWPCDDAGEQTDAALQAVLAPYRIGVSLATRKVLLMADVDAAAEVERARYITPGAGQAMTYQAKADEARRFADAVAPDPADYPLLSAEVGITAPTLAEVAGVVSAAHQQWQLIGGAIEAARLGAKKAIAAAETAEAAEAAAAVAWPGGADA